MAGHSVESRLGGADDRGAHGRQNNKEYRTLRAAKDGPERLSEGADSSGHPDEDASERTPLTAVARTAVPRKAANRSIGSGARLTGSSPASALHFGQWA